MNETETTGRAAKFSLMLDRFSRLTPEGMQRFMGRLIGGAEDKPEVAAEIGKALERLETDAHLLRCWNVRDNRTGSCPTVSEAGVN
jgi:hypothetical protein